MQETEQNIVRHGRSSFEHQPPMDLVYDIILQLEDRPCLYLASFHRILDCSKQRDEG